jgi:hypothetical protein
LKTGTITVFESFVAMLLPCVRKKRIRRERKENEEMEGNGKREKEKKKIGKFSKPENFQGEQ